MSAQHVMLAHERLLAPSHPKPPATDDPCHQLNISVLFTSKQATLFALRKAGALADRLGARITLIFPQIVPYPFPISSPPVLLDIAENRLRQIATESQVETTVRIYLCRDRWEALDVALPPRSVVILGGRKRWWPTAESRCARKLRKAGHEVIITETE